MTKSKKKKFAPKKIFFFAQNRLKNVLKNFFGDVPFLRGGVMFPHQFINQMGFEYQL